MNSTRNIKQDYLAGIPTLSPFYQYSPLQPDFQEIARAKKKDHTDRKLLAEVIREQYNGLDMGEAVENSLSKLAQPDSFTITTGHQLVLFGGPMFTTYKVLTIIKLARQLSEQGLTVVPVFWIHGEDHDFEEINHFYQDFTTKVTYPGEFQTEVGIHTLEKSIEALRPESLSDALTEAYAAGVQMKDAYRAFFHEIFKEYGLLMLDATDARLKAVFASVMEKELLEHTAHAAVTATSQQLGEAGYAQQISPREINLFYLDEQGRNRIVVENGHFALVDREMSFSQEEILTLLRESPEKFSPNVSLRPLYQEMILPNLAYVGGWGELSYWLQLKGLFETTGVNFPLLLPRMSATLIPGETADAWQKFGFDLAEIKRPLHELNEKYVPAVWDRSGFDEYEAKIMDLLESLTDFVKKDISETLSNSADALATKTQQFLRNLDKKAGKIKRQEHHGLFSEIKRLKQQVEPDRVVQERILSLASFGNELPTRDLVSFLYHACKPLDFAHQCLRLPQSNDFGNG